jgi:hypothetical protein
MAATVKNPNTATMMGVSLSTTFYYPNTPEQSIPAGTNIFRVIAGGTVMYGYNHGYEMAGGNIDNIWGQTCFMATLKGTIYGGRRLFLSDTADTVNLGMRHYEGPDCLVTAPVVVGATPVAVPVDSLGSSLAASAWGPKGIGAGNIHAKIVAGNVNIGSFTYGSLLTEGRDFTPGAHKLLGCIGYDAQVALAATVLAAGGSTVKLRGIEFKQLPDSGTFQLSDGRTFTYGAKNSTGTPSDPLKGDLTNCQAVGGSNISLALDQHVYLQITLAAGNQLVLGINPDPLNGARYAGSREGQSIGRLYGECSYTPDGGQVGKDASPGLTDALFTYSGQPSEDAYESAHGGEAFMGTVPNGTKAIRRRVYVRNQGQLDILSGLTYGPIKTLNNPGIDLDPYIRDGSNNVLDSRSRLNISNSVAANAETILTDGALEGQRMRVRFLDNRTTIKHNFANRNGRIFLKTKADYTPAQDEIILLELEGVIWRQL